MIVAAEGASCGLILMVCADMISYIPIRPRAMTRCFGLAGLAYWQAPLGDIALVPGLDYGVERIPRVL